MQKQSIYIDGLKINYKIGGTGTPILILHGWNSSSDKWQKVGELLIQNNFQAIIPDLPGFGKSDFPPCPWSVGDYSESVADFTEKLGLKNFFLFGHSFGGRVAIKFGAIYPERISGLILCSAGGIPAKNKIGVKIFYFLTKTGKFFFSMPFLNKFRKTSRRFLYRLVGVRDYLRATPVMKETMKKVISENLIPHLPQIKLKTLIIWGKKDKILPPSDAYLIKERTENSKLIIMEGVGHAPNLECPGKLAAILIEWLRTT